MLYIKHFQNSLSEAFHCIIQGDYRVVPNTFDQAGGCFVMFGSELAPGETVPSLESFIWHEGEENPVSQDVSLIGIGPLEGKTLRYLCPTCMLPVRVQRSKIDPIVGTNVICSNCKNISHIPGAFGTGTLPSNLKITGGVIVPIKDFSEWYFHHPIVNSLIITRSTDLLCQYGLWGTCAKCSHQYRRTVLYLLPAVQDPFDPSKTTLIAKSAESADDFRALTSGKCPSCGYDKMICIITDIPEYVRETIKTKKEQRMEET
jgi:hypothetical protein